MAQSHHISRRKKLNLPDLIIAFRLLPEYYGRVPKYFILNCIPYTWLSPLLKDHRAHKFEKKDLALN
jgi:hypothetical protein